MPLPKGLTVPSQYQDSVQQLQRRQAIANMLAQQGSAPIETQMSGTGAYPVAVRTSPLEVISKLAQSYAANRMNNDIDQRYSQIAQQMGAQRTQALQDLGNSTTPDQVGAEALDRIRSTPDNQLAEPVQDRGTSMQRAIDSGVDPTVVAALTKKPEGYNLSAGQTRFDARNQPIASVAEKTPEDYVDYVDAGDKRNPVSHRTGAPITGLPAMQKGMTPTSAAADARRNPGASLSDDAIDLAARRLLNGEESGKVLANFGRGNQGAANITAVQNRFAQLATAGGVDAESIATKTQELGAEKRARLELGAREGKIAPRVQEADNFANLALEASAKVPRGNWTDYTGAMQWGAKRSSDPNIGAFQVANNSLINAYAAAVGGGVMHVHDQQKAAEMLSTTDGPAAYEAKVRQLMKETHEALAAPKQVMKNMSLREDKPSDTGLPDDIAALVKKHGGG